MILNCNDSVNGKELTEPLVSAAAFKTSRCPQGQSYTTTHLVSMATQKIDYPECFSQARAVREVRPAPTPIAAAQPKVPIESNALRTFAEDINTC